MNIDGGRISAEHTSLALHNEKVGLWELDLQSRYHVLPNVKLILG